MEKEYKTKDLKAEKKKKTPKVKEELPIFQKRQHWCFVKDGNTLKFASEELARKAYLDK